MPASLSISQGAAGSRPGHRLRVAVVCDYPEERWPSMDLVAELLIKGCRQTRSSLVSVTRIRPRFKHWLTAGGTLHPQAFKADRLLNRLCYYPMYLRTLRQRFDVFHIVDHSYAHLVSALQPARTVVTCHDVDTFRCILKPRLESRSFLFRAMTLLTLRGLRCARTVVCDSRWTHSELLRHRLVQSEQLKVVPVPVAPEFRPGADPTADQRADSLLGGTVAHPLLLHVGSTIPRKRIDILLKVFARVHRGSPEVRLVRVGAPFSRQQMALLRSLSLQNAVVELTELPRRVLAAVYRKSRLVLLPSEREGFGLPLAEALACGTPVLASDLPVLREIGGDAAEYCAVGDIDEWTGRVESALAHCDADSTDRSTRRWHGIERASHLDCSSYAEKMLSVYTTLPN